MVEWRIYGCGSASSNLSLQTSYELVDEDFRLQVDFGNGAIYQRCRTEGDIYRVLDSITHIFMTHSHPDHTVDLTRHVVAWKYTPGYSPGKTVHLYGTKITLDAIRLLLDTVGFSGIYEEVFIPHEISANQPFDIDGRKVMPFSSEHMDGSVGVKIETTAGKQVAFTGDTCIHDFLKTPLSGIDLLVAESSFFEEPHPMHLTVAEAARLADDAGVGALLLVHFYPDIEAKSPQEIQREVSKYYSGPLFLARDGLALSWDEDGKIWQTRKMF